MSVESLSSSCALANAQNVNNGMQNLTPVAPSTSVTNRVQEAAEIIMGVSCTTFCIGSVATIVGFIPAFAGMFTVGSCVNTVSSYKRESSIVEKLTEAPICVVGEGALVVEALAIGTAAVGATGMILGAAVWGVAEAVKCMSHTTPASTQPSATTTSTASTSVVVSQAVAATSAESQAEAKMQGQTDVVVDARAAAAATEAPKLPWYLDTEFQRAHGCFLSNNKSS